MYESIFAKSGVLALEAAWTFCAHEASTSHATNVDVDMTEIRRDLLGSPTSML
jgi:hypothetical protein